MQFESFHWLSHHGLFNNYSPEWSWLVVATLATDTEVNSCFSIYLNSEIKYTTKKLIWMISSLVTDANRDAIFPDLLGGK